MSLTLQLKTDSFGWNDAAEAAFKKLKEAVTTMAVLALPDFSQPFVIEIDASGHGLGAVLMQNLRPRAYFSQVIPPRIQNKSFHERELMGACGAKMETLFAGKAIRGYTLVHGALLYNDRITLPRDSPLILITLQEGHDIKIGEHEGFLKTYRGIAETFHLVGMKDIRSYVAAYTTCQQHKYSTLAPAGLL